MKLKLTSKLGKLLVSPIWLALIVFLLDINELARWGLIAVITIMSILIISSNVKISRVAIATVSFLIVIYLNSIISLHIFQGTERYFLEPFMLTLSIYFGIIALFYWVEALFGANPWAISLIITVYYLLLKALSFLMLSYYLISEFISVAAALMALTVYIFIKKHKFKKFANLVPVNSADYNGKLKVLLVDASVELIIKKNVSEIFVSVRQGSKISRIDKWLAHQSQLAYSEGKDLVLIAPEINDEKILTQSINGTYNNVYVYITAYRSNLDDKLESFKEYIKLER